ncbi:MAG TPA: VOC family protein [Bacteroidia bacterium]
MKRNILITCALAAAFAFGYAFNSFTTKHFEDKPGRVHGVGGIFFKCKDPKKVRAWYHDHLGLVVTQYGSTFEWKQATDSTKKGFTQWSPFPETSKYFLPSTKDFMINYRVDNLEKLVENLKKDGVTVTDTIAAYDYGKFVHILDCEGNGVELWEPVDEVYGKFPGGTTK